MRTPFDPTEHVQHLDDGRAYLDLKWRLVWLRSEHPDAQIETEIVPGADAVVCRATVSLRTGGSATCHGSDSAAVEEAEDRALMRALAALGYGTEFAGDAGREPAEAPSPPVELMTARSLMEESGPSRECESQTQPQPVETSETGAPEPMRGSDVQEQAEASDISWTKFWEWARGRGYRNAAELSELLGVEDVRAYTPREVRRMVKKYELEHPPSGPETE